MKFPLHNTKSFPELLTEELMSVQPMSNALGEVFALSYHYSHREILSMVECENRGYCMDLFKFHL